MPKNGVDVEPKVEGGNVGGYRGKDLFLIRQRAASSSGLARITALSLFAGRNKSASIKLCSSRAHYYSVIEGPFLSRKIELRNTSAAEASLAGDEKEKQCRADATGESVCCLPEMRALEVSCHGDQRRCVVLGRVPFSSVVRNNNTPET